MFAIVLNDVEAKGIKPHKKSYRNNNELERLHETQKKSNYTQLSSEHNSVIQHDRMQCKPRRLSKYQARIKT